MSLQLAVIWYGGRWTLLAPGVRYNRYPSRQSALAAAERLADLGRRQGYEVEILVQEIGGELAPVLRKGSAPEDDAAPRL